MLEWDASGLQLRIGAGMALDENMMKAFVDPILRGDLHSLTGNLVFCPEVPIEEFLKYKKDKTKPYHIYRQKAKNCFPLGTLIKTDTGWKKIEDIVTEENCGSHTEYQGNLKCLSHNGVLQNIESTYFGLSQDWITFIMVNGDEITVTADHTMVVIRNGVEIRVPACEVVESDDIPTVG
jgi:hypothetical protein